MSSGTKALLKRPPGTIELLQALKEAEGKVCPGHPNIRLHSPTCTEKLAQEAKAKKSPHSLRRISGLRIGLAFVCAYSTH